METDKSFGTILQAPSLETFLVEWKLVPAEPQPAERLALKPS